MNNESERFKDSQSEFPKLKGACNNCVGFVTNCKYCRRTVEFRDGKCFDHQAGTLHRCGYGRY